MTGELKWQNRLKTQIVEYFSHSNHFLVEDFMAMMMMNFFCGMVDRHNPFSFISSWDQVCQLEILTIENSGTPRAGFEPEQNLSPGLVEWSCAVVITTTLQCHGAMIPAQVISEKSLRFQIKQKLDPSAFLCFLFFEISLKSTWNSSEI